MSLLIVQVKVFVLKRGPFPHTSVSLMGKVAAVPKITTMVWESLCVHVLLPYTVLHIDVTTRALRGVVLSCEVRAVAQPGVGPL